MRISFIALLMAGLLAGCATGSRDTRDDLAGLYAMTKGGFNESLNVSFSPDGSYALDHEMFACVIGPNGEMPVYYGEEEGTWTLEGGLVVLQPKAQTKDFLDAAVFAPALARRLVPRRDGFTRVLVNADFPGNFVLKRTKQRSHVFGPAAGLVASAPTPDGASTATAILVAAKRQADTPAEEWAWIEKHFPGARAGRPPTETPEDLVAFGHALLIQGDKTYDTLTVQLPDGTERTFYFDISKAFGK